MRIEPPFGYSEIVVLEKNHRVILPAAGHAPEFCRRINAVPLSFTEFARASRDYPIVFVGGEGGKGFGAAAVLGLKAEENLFLRADGRWDDSVYLPAYVRRYPFCMTRINVSNVPRNERVVCVENSAIDAARGEALFDKGSAPLPRWAETEKLLREFEADVVRTEEMCGILRDFGLLEPFSMEAAPNSGEKWQLTGMHRVAERNIEHLSADQLRTLVRKGIMGRIFIHLLSLDNFGRLLDRGGLRAAIPRAEDQQAVAG